MCLRCGGSLVARESEEGGREEDAAWPGRPLQELAAASASAPGAAEGPPAAPRVRVGAPAAARCWAGSACLASRRRSGSCPRALSPGPSLWRFCFPRTSPALRESAALPLGPFSLFRVLTPSSPSSAYPRRHRYGFSLSPQSRQLHPSVVFTPHPLISSLGVESCRPC